VNAPVRRTISAWGSEPRDGTPFHILNTLRFNPIAEQFEALCNGEDGPKWARVGFAGGHEPTVWLRLVPLPYDIPKGFAYTVEYEVRRKTWRERLFDRIFGKLSDPAHFLPLFQRVVEVCRSRASKAGIL
jgi:hypothetical protein